MVAVKLNCEKLRNFGVFSLIKKEFFFFYIGSLYKLISILGHYVNQYCFDYLLSNLKIPVSKLKLNFWVYATYILS